MNVRLLSPSPCLPLCLVLSVALSAAGCGGGGGGGGPSTTSSNISNVVPNGKAIPVDSNEPWTAQYLNGQKVICGVFGGQPGIYIDGSFKPMPQTISGGTSYKPLFLAGNIVYGSYSAGNFSWNRTTNSVADTGAKQAVAVSPNGDYVAFQTAGTSSVLNVSANTEVALAVEVINALSTSGSGVCELVSSGSSPGYRFSAGGSVAKNPLTDLSGGHNYVVQAANSSGALAGEYSGLPGIWLPNSLKPTALGIPGGNSGMAMTMNSGGAVAGSYKSSASSGSFALLWPEGARGPSEFVDINGQFPLPQGAVLTAIYALDPNSLNFIGLVTNADGTQSIQAFTVY